MISRRLPEAAPELSRMVSIVGLGETDYGDDYRASRARREDYVRPTPEALATTAFERALADSGLAREGIDGLAVSFLYGGPTAAETATMLGLSPRHAMEVFGIMAGPLPQVCAAIAEGKCNTVAVVYAVATRSIGRTFGGRNFDDDSGAPPSYYYYHPWGWSSQAAHWALTWRYYQKHHGASDADLGEVAVAMRRHAMAHPQAVMRQPLTIDDYLAARFIVKPLRLFDLCVVNDGAICFIITRTDQARDLPHTPVALAGWGESIVKADKLDALVRGRLRPHFQASGDQALAMAGISLSRIQHLECGDTSTVNLINALEGHGFAAPGTGADFCRAGRIDAPGRLPVNMAGGMLSGSYMHGWSHVAEVVRQLRHEAGPRQIPGVETSMFSLAQTDQVHPMIFTREA